VLAGQLLRDLDNDIDVLLRSTGLSGFRDGLA
jgi:hypothetical protein